MAPVLQLTTLESIQQQVGKDVPRASVAPLVQGVSMQVQKYIDRCLLRESFEEHLDVEPGQQVFSLFHSPIQSVASVTNHGVLVPTECYGVKDHQLRIIDYELTYGPNRLVVTGVGGMAGSTAEFRELYPDIVMEAENWIITRLRRLAAPDVASTSVQGTTVTYVPTTMPKSLADLLFQYKRSFLA